MKKIFLFIAVLIGFNLVGQDILISNCGGISDQYAGEYLRGPDFNDAGGLCHCYEKEGGGIIYWDFGKWEVASGGNCTDGYLTQGKPIHNGTDCTDFWNFTTTFECEITALPDNIPTLSQWGLIILGLCFFILGLVAIRQKSVANYVNLIS